MWAVACEKSNDLTAVFSKQNKTVFWGEMTTNSTKRYFHIDENASSEQTYALLDDVESDKQGDKDNLMNNSDTEFIIEEEITRIYSKDYRHLNLWDTLSSGCERID